MVKFERIRELGDATIIFDVVLDKAYTVQEFINTVLSERENEWGTIGIESPKAVFFKGYPFCEYYCGRLTTTAMPDKVLRRKIKGVKAHGGWSNMDYLIAL